MLILQLPAFVKKTVFIYSGGSGGHIKPALFLTEKLEARGCRVLFFLGSRCLLPSLKDKRILIHSRNKSLFLLQFEILSIYLLFVTLIRKPAAVVGFGGYYSLAGIFAAKLTGAKTYLYEPNVKAGYANRLLNFIGAKMFAVWPDFITGAQAVSPLMQVSGVSAARIFNGQKAESVLILGGSQGALRLNDVFLDLFANYDFQGKKIKFTLITGPALYRQTMAAFEKISHAGNIDVNILEYAENMEELYRSVNIAFSRAGAGAIFELLSFKIPAVLIPYPYACGHQLENARVILNNGCCCLLQEKFMDSRTVSRMIFAMINNKDICGNIREKQGALWSKLSGAGSLAGRICSL